MKMKTVVALACLAVAASSSAAVPFKGVAEGFYGRPWSQEGRLSMLEFMGARGLNTYLYGPKDDPYHHSKWREPYPEAEMKNFAELLKVARKYKIDFFWAIHLGGDFATDSEKQAEDYKALFAKLESMYKGGIRSFAVFFDDFGGSEADQHAEICNRVIKEFLAKKNDCSPLLVCPHEYWGNGTDYQKTLGEKLDPSANLLWTGKGICCDIKAEDVEKITADFRRAPFVWWNWPVNDYCRRKLLLGRTYGVDDCPMAGLVVNPMENCEASKIAIHGFAEWCANPAEFDSKKSWDESFAKIYKDPGVARAMRVFAEHNSDPGDTWHKFRREESVSLEGVTDRKALLAAFSEINSACDTLLVKLPSEYPGLFWEIEGWIKDQKYLIQEARLAFELEACNDIPTRKLIFDRLADVRGRRSLSAQSHRARFANATFENDRKNVVCPEAATTIIGKLVEEIIDRELLKSETVDKGEKK